MKKLIAILAIILISFSGKAQDTTYVLKRAKIYMVMRQEVSSPDAKQKVMIDIRKKKRRQDRIFTIVATSIFAGISVWYWSK